MVSIRQIYKRAAIQNLLVQILLYWHKPRTFAYPKKDALLHDF
jgi:hypothetical protein